MISFRKDTIVMERNVLWYRNIHTSPKNYKSYYQKFGDTWFVIVSPTAGMSHKGTIFESMRVLPQLIHKE